MNFENIIEQAKNLCQENNGKLLYLSLFGSHLYGTDIPSSDFDFKGIFLPNQESCVLGQPAKSITFSSGDQNGKNTKDDIDIQLWSLQYFLKLVSKGETNALDLLYSSSYKEMILHIVPSMYQIFNNHNQFYDIKNCNAYIGYAIGQAKKYGIKGSRLGVLKNIVDLLKSGVIIDEEEKLFKFLIDFIIDNFFDKSYCFKKVVNGEESLVLLGKVHLGNITIREFKERIFRDYEAYGSRAEQARLSNGLDWKALSHACRALCQMRSLILKGQIKYPLKSREFLKRVKNGKYTFQQIESYISHQIDWVKTKLAITDFSKRNSLDKELIRQVILQNYAKKEK